MSQPLGEADLLRGKKRRSSGGGGLVAGEQGWSEEMDAMLETLVRNDDLGMLSSALERIIMQQKSEFEKAYVLEKSACFGLRLHEVAGKLTRQQAAQHNSAVWPLTHDLTVKVFSLLGTQSLCQAAVACSMFNRMAMDPACYVEVDLTMRGLVTVGNHTVSKLVHQAGQCLRSLKLGALPRLNRTPPVMIVPKLDSAGELQLFPVDLSVTPNRVFPTRCMAFGRDSLTKYCLDSLTEYHGLAGSSLTKLHLFNLEKMDTHHLCRALSACPCLTDLEVVGLRRISMRTLIECLGSHCPKLNRLYCEQGKMDWKQYPEESLKTKSCNQLIKGCPDLSYLALRGYGVSDRRVFMLLKGLLKLSTVDFCGALKLTGVFLRGIVGPGDQPSQLNTILLRDCHRLKEAEVERFLYMLISGECKNLRHLDISNEGGLAARDWFHKPLSSSTKQAILRVRQERTLLCLLADFPDQKSSESGSMSDSFDDRGDSEPLGTYSTDSSSSSDSDSDDGEFLSPMSPEDNPLHRWFESPYPGVSDILESEPE
ncbi:F-box protein SKIP17 isoform X1 [Physcomitrium patens]|uniref:F-box domain-containing protein n=1 Tax=Physcomitrium patens TaxID=3218 RepID=A0A7I4EC50_PHYPA|nr:F-box protein SKIP17-like isoform X1 [Physcomitrium patens]|eukprot:XP_024377940.1 F-box protein SKIP17-like isoform X1 [Physcomitrella patens]